jgi:hypothetical protein
VVRSKIFQIRMIVNGNVHITPMKGFVNAGRAVRAAESIRTAHGRLGIIHGKDLSEVDVPTAHNGLKMENPTFR